MSGFEIELVIDEIKTHEGSQRKVLRSKTPAGVYQELYGLFLAHYAVRFLMAQAAIQAHLDPDRLSFTDGLFQLTEMIDLALTARACRSERAAAQALTPQDGTQGLACTVFAYQPPGGQTGPQHV